MKTGHQEWDHFAEVSKMVDPGTGFRRMEEQP